MAPKKIVSSISPPRVHKIGKFLGRWIRRQLPARYKTPSVSDVPILLHSKPTKTTIARKHVVKIGADALIKKRTTREIYSAVSANLGNAVRARMVQKVVTSTFEVIAGEIQRHGECTFGKFMKLEGEFADQGNTYSTSYSMRISSKKRLNTMVHGRASVD